MNEKSFSKSDMDNNASSSELDEAISQSVDCPEIDLEEAITQLHEIYKVGKRSDEFTQEQDIYRELLPGFISSLCDAGFKAISPIAIGSTASVWKICDIKLKQIRAAKLARPRFGKLNEIIRILRDEGIRLADLNHHNIIRIYYASEVAIEANEQTFPYFVMDFLHNVQDLDDFIYKHITQLTGTEIIDLFQDILSGLEYLHQPSVGIIHVDIKPGNVLVAQNRRAQIADFGYSKRIRREDVDTSSSKMTEARFTQGYAHPKLRELLVKSSDPDANKAVIDKSQLKESFDLFALGRTLQEILAGIRKRESSYEYKRPDGYYSIFSTYQWQYLETISTRLLDGVVDHPIDCIPGLPSRTMEEIKYRNANDALEDISKLLNFYDLEGEVPELNPNISTYIQIPNAKIPLTPRVKAVINHPIFTRLGQISQLGFVSLLYPGASHTRLEHVLGTFALTCEYIRALWYSDSDCLFRSIMCREDIESAILLALIHDIGQYPMAHDMTEISTKFAHERFSEAVLTTSDDMCLPLIDVIQDTWGLNANYLLSLYAGNQPRTFREKIIQSIINGPLDTDKVDYLRRDSLHIGVLFGKSVDVERLIRNLVVAHKANSSGDSLEVAEVGVAWKAMAAARSIWKAREDMHRQVYWHHTVRSLKAMLGYVARHVLIQNDEDEREAVFWRDFSDWLSGRWHVAAPDFFSVLEADEDEEVSEIFNNVGCKASVQFHRTQLCLTDDSLLWLLWKYSNESAREVIENIRRRNLYQRIAVLSGSLSMGLYKKLYEHHRTHLETGDLKKIEESRTHWQIKVIDFISDKLSHLDINDNKLQKQVAELKNVDPLILVDIPVKSARKLKDKEKVWYLPEEITGLHSLHPVLKREFQSIEVGNTNRSFDQDIGKIRVYAHPRFADVFRSVPKQYKLADEILEILSI